jgi:hypothetical protein
MDLTTAFVFFVFPISVVGLIWGAVKIYERHTRAH